jgi:fructokinase
MSATVAVIGEAVIDRFLESDGPRDVIGGSPLNTAVALKRAGVDVNWWGRMSSGPEGAALVAYADENGVGGSSVKIVDEPATLVTIELNAEGVPSYGFYLEGAADWGWSVSDLGGLSDYKVLQIGSLGAVLEPASSAILQVITEMKASGTAPLITYDPNARPKAANNEAEANRVRARVEELVAVADLVKVSDEDLEWLHQGVDPLESARLWSTAGPRLVVMTRGGSGAVAFVDGQEIASVPGVLTEVVDTVGAGDTFMAWLLRSIVAEHSCTVPSDLDAVTRVLTQAAQAAAITCSRKGCNPPFAAEVL